MAYQKMRGPPPRDAGSDPANCHVLASRDSSENTPAASLAQASRKRPTLLVQSRPPRHASPRADGWRAKPRIAGAGVQANARRYKLRAVSLHPDDDEFPFGQRPSDWRCMVRLADGALRCVKIDAPWLLGPPLDVDWWIHGTWAECDRLLAYFGSNKFSRLEFIQARANGFV
jgi:hypothetical protein